MEEPMSKKSRVWNPAVEEDSEKACDDNFAVKCEKNMNVMKAIPNTLPMLLQSYFTVAPMMLRMQQNQQRQMEEVMRRRQMEAFAKAALNAQAIAARTSAASAPGPAATSSTVLSPPSSNPLVQSALLGSPILTENCCAVCGAAFRLTGDLVQHMRNNHRRTKFKRKNDKTQL